MPNEPPRVEASVRSRAASLTSRSLLVAIALALVLSAAPTASAWYQDEECWETGDGYGCQRAKAECDGWYVFVYGSLGWNMVCVQVMR